MSDWWTNENANSNGWFNPGVTSQSQQPASESYELNLGFDDGSSQFQPPQPAFSQHTPSPYLASDLNINSQYHNSGGGGMPMPVQTDPNVGRASPYYNNMGADYMNMGYDNLNNQVGGDAYAGSMFIPDQHPPKQYLAGGNDAAADLVGYGFEDEPPLLQELGINFDHIKQKTIAVLNPVKIPDASVIQDNDLAGPLCFCLLFGVALLLHGKLQFGYIYGIGLVGCMAVFALLNLMSLDGISILCTVSVLGYCLLPMAVLSCLAAVLSLQGIIGYAVSAAAVLWCSSSASKLFVIALQMDHQRLLVAYPCSLLYAVFALLAIF